MIMFAVSILSIDYAYPLKLSTIEFVVKTAGSKSDNLSMKL